jgi:hypothetical protein
MKHLIHRRKVFLLLIVFLLCVGCTKNERKGKEWLCAIQIPKRSEESVLCDTVFQTTSGQIVIENHTVVDVCCYLFDTRNLDEPIRTLDIGAGGSGILYEIDAEKSYQIGIQATVSEEREVELLISEYPSGDIYTVK